MTNSIANCYLCGSVDWNTFREFEEYKLLKCKKCHFIILHPLPSEEVMTELYGNDYFIRHIHYQMPAVEEEIEREIQKRFYFIEWLRLTCKLTKGKLLEVGSAAGFLLKALQRVGWDVVGIEISEASSSYARNRLNLDVRTGVVSTSNLGNELFDVILMLSTLEHIPNPLVVLKLLREHLQDNGYLIVQVPNINSLEACIQGNQWEGWDIPFHFNHFSLKTLQALLVKSGYKILYREYSLPLFEKRILKSIKLQPSGGNVSPHYETTQGSRFYRLRKGLLHLNKTLPLGRDVTVVAIKAF